MISGWRVAREGGFSRKGAAFSRHPKPPPLGGWSIHSPQNYGWHLNKDIPEELTVAVAEHPTTNIGRSFHNGHEPADAQQHPGQGIYFEEQFKQAMKVKPEFLFITGWNEWTAGRLLCEKDGGSTFLGRTLKKEESFWVDEFDQEFIDLQLSKDRLREG